MKILCFGIAREIVGGRACELELPPGTTVAGLRDRLLTAYPALGELAHFAIARNEVYAAAEEVLGADDEVVIIPPVSGG